MGHQCYSTRTKACPKPVIKIVVVVQINLAAAAAAAAAVFGRIS